MVRATDAELHAVARLAEPALHDHASELALRRALEEYLPRRRQAIGTVAFEVDGRPVESLYAALAERDVAVRTLALRRTGPAPAPSRWEYLRPFDSLRIAEDGSAEVARAEGAPTRAIARLLLREHYVPAPAGPGAGTIGRALPPPGLFRPEEFAEYVRQSGIVPFGIALAVYFPDTRIRYELDLVDSGLLLDSRTDRLPVGRRVARSARIGHAVDTLIGHGDLALPSARAYEVTVESNGLSAMDLAPLYGGVRELAAAALDTLVGRRLLHFDRRTGMYRPRLEALAGRAVRPRPSAIPVSRASARLRTSVMELLAAAESRATCPLCGDPLPAGYSGILCTKCQVLIGEGAPAPPTG